MPIHHAQLGDQAVEGRGFKTLYLPAYSPFPNLIELFWPKVKAGVRRELLTKDDSLTPRTIVSAKHVTAKSC